MWLQANAFLETALPLALAVGVLAKLREVRRSVARKRAPAPQATARPPCEGLQGLRARRVEMRLSDPKVTVTAHESTAGLPTLVMVRVSNTQVDTE